jgi:Raf kinase inhibitor-like YbhB/YbcL family protein
MGNGRRWGWRILVLLLLVVIFSAVLLMVWRSRRGKDIVDAGTVPALVVTSASFADGSVIPAKFTCDGGDVSPQLTISAPPDGSRSLLWIMDDPDVPMGSFVHWVAFNLPAGLRELPEGAAAQPETLQGAVQGKNDFDKIGYGGPCPPGGKPHHYLFRVYALDTLLQLSEGSTRKEVALAAKGHVLAEGKLMGLYTRSK